MLEENNQRLDGNINPVLFLTYLLSQSAYLMLHNFIYQFAPK